MIITMCSSSILNEMRRLKDNVTFKPEELDVHIVWKEGATPQPNPNPAKPPPPPASAMLADGQPLPIVPPPSEDVATSSEAAAEGDEEKWPEGMPKVTWWCLVEYHDLASHTGIANWSAQCTSSSTASPLCLQYNCEHQKMEEKAWKRGEKNRKMVLTSNS